TEPAGLPAAGGLLPAPFHLRRRLRGGCVFSVALSFGSPRPGVTRHPALRSSDFPRRDDPGATAWRTHRRFYTQAVLGISSGVSRAASSSNAAATPIAAVSPTWISGPEMADPSGVPAKFSDIETANARPYQAGSVRRCRIE